MDNKSISLGYPNSNRALQVTHFDWVPKYTNPYNMIFTFANDVSEQYARDKYSLLIRKLSKNINGKGYIRYGNIIEQRGYLEMNSSGRLHIHALCDVRDDWDDRFKALVYDLWIHGIVVKIKKVPVCELPYVQEYNSKMKTKNLESGYYSDSYLIID